MLIPTSGATCDIVVRKSRFIGISVPVTSQEAARESISEARQVYPDASHVVHSYILGPKGDIFSFSDDREPKNTAGRPVLEVLKGSGITNILVLVIRYFGGTKLGTGGLVHAYSGAAKEVLRLTPVEPMIETCEFSVLLAYEHYEQVKKALIDYHARDITESFETSVFLSGTIPKEHAETAARQVSDLTAGRSFLSTPKP